MRRYQAFLVSMLFASSAVAQTFSIQPITNNTTSDNGIVANDVGDIAWIGSDGTGTGLFLFTASTGATAQITNNFMFDGGPVLNNRGDMLWSQQVILSDGRFADDLYKRDGATGVIEKINTLPVSGPVSNYACGNYGINNRGDIVWAEVVQIDLSGGGGGGGSMGGPPGGAGQPTICDIFYFNSTTKTVKNISNNAGINTPPDAPTNSDKFPVLNNNGVVIWLHNTDATIGQLDIHRYDASTDSTVNVTISTAVEQSIQLNDSGDMAWVASQTDSDIFLYEAQTGATTQITPPNGVSDSAPVLSASGNLVWNQNLILMYFDATTRATATIGRVYQFPGVFTGNGDVVFYGLDPTGTVQDLYVYSPATQHTTNISNDDAVNWPFSVNAAGDVAYSFSPNTNRVTDEIVVYTAATGELTQLTSNAVFDGEPTMSNSGDVFWAHDFGNSSEIYRAVPVVSDVDLVIPSLSVVASFAETGADITAAVLVQNIGTTDQVAAGSTVQFYLSTDPVITSNDRLIGNWTHSALTAGASESVAVDLLVPSDLEAGSYYLGAIVDALSEEEETNEDNNASTGPLLTITAPVESVDLVLTKLSTEKSRVRRGRRFEVEVEVTNQGTTDQTVPESTVLFYLSEDETITADDTRIGSWTHDAVDAGESDDDSPKLRVPYSLSRGTYYLGAIADGLEEQTETDEDNNAFTGRSLRVR